MTTFMLLFVGLFIRSTLGFGAISRSPRLDDYIATLEVKLNSANTELASFARNELDRMGLNYHHDDGIASRYGRQLLQGGGPCVPPICIPETSAPTLPPSIPQELIDLNVDDILNQTMGLDNKGSGLQGDKLRPLSTFPYLLISPGVKVSYETANTYCIDAIGTRLASLYENSTRHTEEEQGIEMQERCKTGGILGGTCWIGLMWHNDTNAFHWENGFKWDYAENWDGFGVSPESPPPTNSEKKFCTIIYDAGEILYHWLVTFCGTNQGDPQFVSKEFLCDNPLYDQDPTPAPITQQPSTSPSGRPTTIHPTNDPTTPPTKVPSDSPTSSPTGRPTTIRPTTDPTTSPTKVPTGSPTEATNPPTQPTERPTTSDPSEAPTSPTKSPTDNPSTSPTKSPTKSPTNNPSTSPTKSPTESPSGTPSASPTKLPTKAPSNNPTTSPTNNPSTSPTESPSDIPTTSPTRNPTSSPTKSPSANPSTPPTEAPSKTTNTPTGSPTSETAAPTLNPSTSPTKFIHPTGSPTASTTDPTRNPTSSPTKSPTDVPSTSPTKAPSDDPTTSPTKSPSANPTTSPTKSPTGNPTAAPSDNPSTSPTKSPTKSPSTNPSVSPTKSPSKAPSDNPSTSPSKSPTGSPSKNPTTSPTKSPTNNPSTSPSNNPSTTPSEPPTGNPSGSPTKSPSKAPTESPSKFPTTSPTDNPSGSPTKAPTDNPSGSPTKSPSGSPTTAVPTFTEPPTNNPSVSPTNNPSTSPTESPTGNPSVSPTNNPSTPPTESPTGNPSGSPTKSPTDDPTVSPTKQPSSSPTDNPTKSPITKRPTGVPTKTPTEAPSSSTDPCGDERGDWMVRFPCLNEGVFKLVSRCDSDLSILISLDNIWELNKWSQKRTGCDRWDSPKFYWNRQGFNRTFIDTLTGREVDAIENRFNYGLKDKLSTSGGRSSSSSEEERNGDVWFNLTVWFFIDSGSVDINNDGNSLEIMAGTLKWSLNVENWPFDDDDNELEITFTATLQQFAGFYNALTMEANDCKIWTSGGSHSEDNDYKKKKKGDKKDRSFSKTKKDHKKHSKEKKKKAGKHHGHQSGHGKKAGGHSGSKSFGRRMLDFDDIPSYRSQNQRQLLQGARKRNEVPCSDSITTDCYGAIQTTNAVTGGQEIDYAFGFDFHIVAPETAVIDGATTDIKIEIVSGTDTSVTMTYYFPKFDDLLSYDPNVFWKPKREDALQKYSEAIATPIDDDNDNNGASVYNGQDEEGDATFNKDDGTKNVKDNGFLTQMINNLSWEIWIVIIIGFVLIITGCIGSGTYLLYKRRQNTHENSQKTYVSME